MAKQNKTKNKTPKYWQRCGKNRTCIHCWWECKLMQPLWKPVWKLLKMLNIVTIWPSNSTPGCIPKTVKAHAHTWVFTVPLFLTAKKRKQPKCPWINEWIKKSGTSKQQNITQPWRGKLHATTWMLSEKNQP